MALYKKKRNRNMMGRFPLGYFNTTPGADYSMQLTWNDRAPTTRDYDNWFMGCIWIDESKFDAGPPVIYPEVWMLVNKENNIARWVRFYGGAGALETLTGDNTTVVVTPDAADNINISGGNHITTVGALGTNSVTIDLDTDVVSTVTTDAGTVTPVANNLNFLAGENTNTSALGDAMYVHLNRTIHWPDTNAAGTEGVIYLGATCTGTACTGGDHFMHNYGTNNTFLGALAGNLTLDPATTIDCVGIGTNALGSLTDGASGLTAVGSHALALALTSDYCTAVGYYALSSWAGGGGAHTAVGYNCMRNTVASISGCTGVGSNALLENTTGVQNIGIGAAALRNCTDSTQNIGIGNAALSSLTTGSSRNVGIGHATLGGLTSCNYCTCVGVQSMTYATSGDYNTCVGSRTAELIVSGSHNTIMGYSGGFQYRGAESSNVCLGSGGALGDNNTLRVGGHGVGSGQQNRCFIAGIRGITTGVADAIPVLIDSAYQLGTVSSSIRYKENVQDLGEESENIYKLRPVTFNYKTDETKSKQYGLIAEEVIEHFPRLVVRDADGEIETVKYMELISITLNEVIEQHKVVKNLKDRVRILEEQVSLLLEKKISD